MQLFPSNGHDGHKEDVVFNVTRRSSAPMLIQPLAVMTFSALAFGIGLSVSPDKVVSAVTQSCPRSQTKVSSEASTHQAKPPQSDDI